MTYPPGIQAGEIPDRHSRSTLVVSGPELAVLPVAQDPLVALGPVALALLLQGAALAPPGAGRHQHFSTTAAEALAWK